MSDLIRRQDAIYAIIDELMPSTPLSAVIRAKSRFKDLPAVQPERKPGRWEEHIFEGIMGGRPRALMCNQCNSLSLHATNFCPNCGADMRGGDAE